MLTIDPARRVTAAQLARHPLLEIEGDSMRDSMQDSMRASMRSEDGDNGDEEMGVDEPGLPSYRSLGIDDDDDVDGFTPPPPMEGLKTPVRRNAERRRSWGNSATPADALV